MSYIVRRKRRGQYEYYAGRMTWTRNVGHAWQFAAPPMSAIGSGLHPGLGDDAECVDRREAQCP